MTEQIQKETSPLEMYDEITDYEPKLITNFVPSNAKEQKNAFMQGEAHFPCHIYGKLDEINFDQTIEEIIKARENLQLNQVLNPKHLSAYEQFIDDYVKKTKLMEAAHHYNVATDISEKATSANIFMKLNKEIYGEPDERTYRSLLFEKLNSVADKDLSPELESLRDELFAMVDYDPLSSETIERFHPSDETVEWVRQSAETLYGGMLLHIPEQESFTVYETRDIFETIIHEEFGDAAVGWRVDVEPAKSINVKSTEKRVVIPDDRGDLKNVDLRRFAVHELGVHVFRSITGEETDLAPLKNGLSGYYDFEEGLGMVMEQAIQGEFKEAGTDHYITAGLSYHDDKDFREIYEIKWRLLALINSQSSDESIANFKNAAYGGTMRILRGTDELPWFKDLAYYNGAIGVWKHLEKIKGDDLLFSFVLLGKADPTRIDHQRVVLETRSI